jgi:hypothetical protein
MVNIAHLQKLNQGSEPRGEAREAGRLTPEAVVRPQEALLPPAIAAGLAHRSRCNGIYVLRF